MSHLFKRVSAVYQSDVTLSLSLFIYVTKSENLDYDFVFTALYEDKFLNIVQFVKL